jgi:hypothetical protein
MRFTVFGCRNDVLVDAKADHMVEALRYARYNSQNGFKARIWDGQRRQFVRWGAAHYLASRGN